MANFKLLGTTNRVSVPFVKVQIGDYVFGVFEKQDLKKGVDVTGVYKLQKVKYPNFIQSLQVVKINGTVNQYTLALTYPITEGTDPNFFEKVFSSVSKPRKIVFSYGDMSAPTYIYRDEQAIITTIKTSFNMMSSTISYTVSAVSTSAPTISGAHTFRARTAKPSDVIKEILYQPKYGLLEVFTGMRDKALVLMKNLIPGNDKIVNIGQKSNMSVLEYLNYLVSSMTIDGNTLKKKRLYALTVIDDTSGEFGGPYFKIWEVAKRQDDLETYEIDIGYPSQNVVIAFAVDNNENYSIYYDYQKEINDAEYVQRINDQGEIEEVYAPIVSSKSSAFDTNEATKSWWSRVTEYPISASIVIRGLLRPAILMTHVRLNVIYYGQKHISSGLYIVTGQEDKIDSNGYQTTLKLLRVDADNAYQ